MQRTLMFLCLALAPVFAGAVDVYKCKGPDGEIQFSNTPCAGSPSAGLHSSYSSAPPANREYIPAAEASAYTSRRDDPYPVQGVGNTSSRANERAGYTCESNGKRWIQVDPCPSATTTLRAAPVTVHNPFNGRISNGTTTVREQHEVRETSLNRDDICARLRRNEAVSSRRQSASDAAYERNKLRQQNGC